MARQGIDTTATRSLRVWGAGWLCRLTTALGSAARWAECRMQGEGRGASDEAALPKGPLAES
jgi:hypothetical protein